MYETEFELPIVPDDGTMEAVEETVSQVVVPLNPAARVITYPLAFPLKVDGKPLRVVRLRRPTQGDMDDLSTGVIPTNRDLLCKMTGLSLTVIRNLDVVDSERLHSLLFDLIPDFLKDE